MNQPLLTAKQVAARWNCSPRHVYLMIERGQLPVIHLGPKLVRIHPRTVEAIEQCQSSGSTDQPSTGEGPQPGTSSGPKADAAVVSLQRRMIVRSLGKS